MCPVVVVVANVFGHEPFQVALVEHNNVIEQVAAAGADESFGNAVLPRAFERSANRFYVEYFRSLYDLSTEGGVAAVNQIARCCVKGKASRNCCITQVLVGCRVTLQCKIRR
jgi:hypothetical protein